MHRIAALFVAILLVLSGGGNFADPVPATPAPLLPIPGTPQAPDPLGGFRGLQPTPAVVTPSAPNASRFDLPQWGLVHSDDFESPSSDSPWMRPLDRYLAHESGNQFVRLTGDGTRLPLSFGYIHDTSLEALVRIQSGTLRMGIHSSAAGAYVVELDETGHLNVMRGLKPIAEPVRTSTQFDGWSHIEMSVTGHEVRVKLDGSTVVQVTDTDPLFYGTVWFAAVGSLVEVDVDNIVLSGRIDAEPDVLMDTHVTRSVSPDVSRQSTENDRIVFFSNAGHLFTLKPDGSELLWLTEGIIDVDHLHPSWSPNKERIAFVTQQSGGNRIYTMNSAGTDRQLVPVPLSSPYRSAQDVAWSPVDDRLLYTATSIYGVKSVSIFDMTTGTDILIGDGSAVSWSPDGTKVHIFRSEPWPSNQHNLWQVDLTTSVYVHAADTGRDSDIWRRLVT